MMQIEILRNGVYVLERVPSGVALGDYLMDSLPDEALQPGAGVPEAGYYWREVE